jgi:hypothetical protein
MGINAGPWQLNTASPSIKNHTDKLLVNLLSKSHPKQFMQSDSVIMLPPYWFDVDNIEHQSIRSRIRELEKLRDTIIDEINYLQSATTTTA